MRNIDIPQPCSENFHLMTPTERGAFCEKCSIDTYDFRDKTNDQIRGILKANMGQEVCGRFTGKQLEELNKDFEEWTFTSTKSFQSGFLFALIAVFGLTLFSCTDQQQETEIISFQETTKNIVDNINTNVGTAFVAEDSIQAEPIVPEIMLDYWEYEIGGVLDYNYPQVVQEPLELIEPEIIRGYAGGISYTQIYSDYVEKIVTDEYDENGNVIPKEYSSLTFPNPTSSTSTLEIKAPKKGDFKIDLYDLNGKFIQSIYEGEIERGIFRQEYDMTDLPTGMYLVTIVSRKYKETVRVSKI